MRFADAVAGQGANVTQTLEQTASAMAFAVQSINRMPPVTEDDMRRLDGLLAEMAEALTNLEEKK